MQQSASKKQPEEKRSASDSLRIAGFASIGLGLIAGAAGFQFGFAAGIPLAICFAILGALLIVWSAFVARREASRGRFAAFLQSELGSDWNPEGLRVRKYKEGTPRDIDLQYQARQPDHDPEWRAHLTDAVRQRMGVDEIKATWKPKRNRVRMLGIIVVLTALSKARTRAIERIRLVLQPLFRGVELNVAVPTWSEEDELMPTRIELAYGVTSVDGSDLWVRRVEAMAGLKLGNRWRASFDPTRDTGYLEPRPVLPSNVPHPGIELYTGMTEASPFPVDLKSPTLYYGIDENGKPRGWKLGKTSTMPHGLFIGPTGGGKTTVLRSLIVGAVAQGIPVFAADPKMIELTPFYGFPGCYIASTPEEIATMIESMEGLMYARYDAIKKNPAAADTFSPVLFILDELLILRQVLKRHHAKTVGRGTPPGFESIAALAALARSAKINLAIGVQRPDASLFDDGARDNFRQRLSLMRLSPQGSEMLWGSRYVGVDLPMVQGRAMASPDGDNPVEIQTFWIADPITATGEDRKTIEDFRRIATQNFLGYVPPIDVSPFVGNMPEIDIAALPTASSDIDLGVSDEIDESSSGLTDMQDVKAEQLADGDRIVMDDGEELVIVSSEEDEWEEDMVRLTVLTPGGTEEFRSLSRDHYVSRVIDLAEAA